MHGAGESVSVLQLHVSSGRQAPLEEPHRLPFLERNTDRLGEEDEKGSVYGSRIEVAWPLLCAACVHRIEDRHNVVRSLCHRPVGHTAHHEHRESGMVRSLRDIRSALRG